MADPKVQVHYSLKDTASKGLKALTKHAKLFAIAGLGAITLALKKSISFFAKQEQVLAQTEAVIKSTGEAAGISAEEVNELAQSLQKVTAMGDETIQTGQNMLLTFTNIGKDVFPKATETMLDMATAMNGGAIPSAEMLRSTAIQLGKALNDPTIGATALRRVGVTLTEQQMEQIKAFQENGEMAKAQGVILKELSVEFGGVARAQAKTFAGTTDQMRNAIGDLGETIGGQLVPVLTIAFQKMTSFVEKLKEKAELQNDSMQDNLRLLGEIDSKISDLEEKEAVFGEARLERIEELQEQRQAVLEQLGEITGQTERQEEVEVNIAEAKKARIIQEAKAKKKADKEALKAKEKQAKDYATWEDFMLSSTRSASKEIASIGKAIAIKNVIFKTSEASMGAYNSMVGIPFIGPVLGMIAAGAALAFGGEQIQAIQSEGTALASGGLVTGPTNALVGEAGTEAVLNLDDEETGEKLNESGVNLGGGGGSGILVLEDGTELAKYVYKTNTEQLNSGELSERS